MEFRKAPSFQKESGVSIYESVAEDSMVRCIESSIEPVDEIPLPELEADTTTQNVETDDYFYYTTFTFRGAKHTIRLSEELQRLTYKLCLQYGVDYEIILAIMGCESGWDTKAIGDGKCIGLGMISKVCLPDLNKAIGITDLSIPEQNIEAICYLISTKKLINNGNISAALMSYNYGQSRAEYYFHKGVYESSYSIKVIEMGETLKTIKASIQSCNKENRNNSEIQQ